MVCATIPPMPRTPRDRQNKGMCFRLLYTLHQGGFFENVDERRSWMIAEVRRRKRFRIG